MLAMLAVGMREERHEIVRRHRAEIQRARSDEIFRHDAKDAAVGLVPRVGGVEVAQAHVGPIGDVDRAVGAELDIHGAKRFVVGGHERSLVHGAKARCVAQETARLHAVRHRHTDDHLALERGHRTALVNHESLREALAVALVLHVLEKSEDERIHRRAVLGPALHVGRALRVVQAARRAAVGPGKRSAKLVELKAERVAAALGEDFEDFCAGVVAPDILSTHALTLNLIGRRAAVGPVDPAVGAPV